MGNLNPFIKLDGYWVLADYLGITEIPKVIIELWTDVIRTIFHKTKAQILSKTKKIILYIYTVFAAVFFIYFFRILINSIMVAVQNIVSDISRFVEAGLSVSDITFLRAINYLSGRISTVIVIIFFIRLVLMIIRKSIQKLRVIKQERR